MYIKSFLLAGAVCLSGCANLNSIHHNKTLSDRKPSIFSMDARQRAIISRPTMEVGERVVNDDNGNPAIEKVQFKSVRMCAEQFPDVFTVLSASLSAQLDAKNDKQVQSLSGSLAAAMQESGTTIARTQTVNLLREVMYRTCERYMNGALDKNSFILQATRDQQNMVSVLAIEQLTGVVTPPSSSLFGASGAFNQSKLDTTALAAMLNDAKIGRDNAKGEKDVAQTAYDAALSAGGKTKCEDITDADKKSACQTAKASLDNAVKEYDRAIEHYNNVNKLVDATTKSINAALAASFASNQNAINNNKDMNTEKIKAVAEAVTDIVALTFKANNLESACIQLILQPGNLTSEKDPRMAACMNMLRNGQSNQTSSRSIAYGSSALPKSVTRRVVRTPSRILSPSTYETGVDNFKKGLK